MVFNFRDEKPKTLLMSDRELLWHITKAVGVCVFALVGVWAVATAASLFFNACN